VTRIGIGDSAEPGRRSRIVGQVGAADGGARGHKETDMSVTIKPAPALDERRHDAGHRGHPGHAVGWRPNTFADDRVRTRVAGCAMAAGALAWSVTTVLFPWHESERNFRITDLTGLAFQLGVMALLTVMMRTQAVGTSRKARIALRVEFVLLSLASTWSLLHAIVPDTVDSTPLAILDVFWPLSMLGMFVIGIKLAVTGRWRGALRGWPLIAESWAMVTIPAMGIFGQSAADWVGATHLLVGYCVVGLLLVLRPELTEADG
jgi:hypothetical protein